MFSFAFEMHGDEEDNKKVNAKNRETEKQRVMQGTESVCVKESNLKYTKTIHRSDTQAQTSTHIYTHD